MHAIKEKPVVVDGQIVIRPIMVVALTYDHRMLDGREAVTFLGELTGVEGGRFILMAFNSADEGVLRRPAKDVTTLSGSRSRSLLASLSIHLLLKKRWTIHGTSHARVTGRYEGEEWTGQRGDGVRASLRSRQDPRFMSLLNLSTLGSQYGSVS